MNKTQKNKKMFVFWLWHKTIKELNKHKLALHNFIPL